METYYRNQSKQTGEIWKKLSSGLIVPNGKFTDTRSHSKTTFDKIRKHAEDIERLYADAEISLPKSSGLGMLTDNAKKLCDNWLANKKDKIDDKMFFLGMHLDRIAKAVLPLKSEKKRDGYLKHLLSGSLNFFEREKAEAKNFLWELEVWSWLREKTENVELEEPDITVNYDGSFIGIACKKLYSEKNAHNIPYKKVKQIEKRHEFGIVAINIDNLLPENNIIQAENINAANEMLRKNNDKFLGEHSRYFEKYFSENRLIAAIVSTSAIVDIPSEKPQFRNMYQRVIWNVEGLSTKHKEQVDNFRKTVMD